SVLARKTLTRRSPLRSTSLLRSRRPCRKRLWVHRCSWERLHRTLGDDSFPRFQPFINNPHGPYAFSDLDGPEADLVIAVNHSHLVTALLFHDRALRHQKSAFFQIGHRADAAILTWAQDVSRVGEDASQTERPGPLIDLQVGDEEFALLRIGRSVG